MAESEEDWFFDSISRYKNLNMFELDYPVHHLEFTSSNSICIFCSNNKRHQLLELALPLKLTSQMNGSSEMIITNDTDLKIKCGTFTQSKIAHMKASTNDHKIIASFSNKPGAVLYALSCDGSDEINEESTIACELEGSSLALHDTELALAKDSSSPLFLINTSTGQTIEKVALQDLMNCNESVAPLYIEPSVIALCYLSTGGVQLFDRRDSKLINGVSCDKTDNFWTFSSFHHSSPNEEHSICISMVSDKGNLKLYDSRNLSSPYFCGNLGIKSSNTSIQHQFKPYGKNWISASGFDENVYVYQLLAEPELVFVHDGHRHVEGYNSLTTTTGHLWLENISNGMISSADNGTIQSWQFEDKRNLER